MSRDLEPFYSRGGNRARTCDLLDAIETLSQLSYTPVRNIRLSKRGGCGQAAARFVRSGDGSFRHQCEMDAEAVGVLRRDVGDERAAHRAARDQRLLIGEGEADALSG